jgi:hypothetical protein
LAIWAYHHYHCHITQFGNYKRFISPFVSRHETRPQPKLAKWAYYHHHRHQDDQMGLLSSSSSWPNGLIIIIIIIIKMAKRAYADDG